MLVLSLAVIDKVFPEVIAVPFVASSASSNRECWCVDPTDHKQAQGTESADQCRFPTTSSLGPNIHVAHSLRG